MKISIMCRAVEKVKCSECKRHILIDEEVLLVVDKLWDNRLYVEDVVCKECASVE